MNELDTLLLALLFDELEPHRRDALLIELDADPSLAERFRALQTELGDLAPAEPPSPPSRGHLLRDVATTARFRIYDHQVAALFDVSPARARALLGQLDGDWGVVFPGLELIQVEPGPGLDDAIAGFMRVAPGVVFPHHTHAADEHILMLQGACQDVVTTDPDAPCDGPVHGAGDAVTWAQGTAHHFVALPGAPFVFAVVARGTRFPPTQ
jgi:putative transcriptional regulator